MRRKNPCKVCGANESAMIFANDTWCSDSCRKLLSGEWSAATFELVSGKFFNPQTGLYDRKIIGDRVEDRSKR